MCTPMLWQELVFLAASANVCLCVLLLLLLVSLLFVVCFSFFFLNKSNILSLLPYGHLTRMCFSSENLSLTEKKKKKKKAQ